jgi:hypothetical protein|tara:strand:+ start:95 stop:298 length:204 start_codon:yes stop_codon:yes gene_type:complete
VLGNVLFLNFPPKYCKIEGIIVIIKSRNIDNFRFMIDELKLSKIRLMGSFIPLTNNVYRNQIPPSLF